MDKSEFLKHFLWPPDKIRMLFNVDPFMKNVTIKITKEAVALEAMLEYYVPKFKKSGNFDTRGIEEQIADPETLPIAISEVMKEPAEWGLGIDTSKLPEAKHLDPVPIATDLKSNKTLVLDSNHTIVNLIRGLGPRELKRTHIPIVHIKGVDLEDVICDFKILNRL